MTAAPDEPKIDPSQTRGAAEWGLASLLLGGVLALMAMLTLQINLHIFLGPRNWSPNDVRPILFAAVPGGIFVLGMTGASIAFGIRSLALAYQRAQPCALGWAGLLISTLGLPLWILTLIDLLGVLHVF